MAGLRIGVVGVGFGTAVHIPAFQSEGLEVVAVCSRRRERAEEAAAKFSVPNVFTDYEEMLARGGLDAVSIVTPPCLHVPMAISALEAGKHVLCEKPFALDANEASRGYEAAKASGLTAMMAHEFRHSSGRAWAAELIRDGYVGKLRMCLIRLVLGGPAGPAPFAPDRDLADRGGGFLFALGSHYIDCLRAWFGEIDSVSGDVRTLVPERDDGGKTVMADADDTFSFNVTFTAGGFAQMIASRSAPFGTGPAVEVYGDQGSLFLPQTLVNPPDHGTVLGAKLGEEKPSPIAVPERLETFRDERDERLTPFRLLVRDFLRGIDEGTSPSPNFFDGMRCQQVLDAVRESSATGKTVSIPPVPSA